MWQEVDPRNLGVLAVCSLAVVIVLQPQQSAGAASCPAGWFGQNCAYMCHCSTKGAAPGTTCHETTGECPANTFCASIYLGTGCQYVNVLPTFRTPALPSFLSSGGFAVCNNNTNLTHLFISLLVSFHFTGFRIFTRTDMSNHALTLVLGDNDACPNQRTYRVSANMLDVSCDTTKLYDKFYIKGAVVAEICKLSVTAGRNVALRQTATQSSDFFQSNFTYSAKLAVDGSHSNRSMSGRTCATTNSLGDPWWALLYNLPQKLTAIEIYNTEKSQDQLVGFTLELYALPNDTQSLFKYTDTTNTTANEYMIHIPPMKSPIKFLKIATSGRTATDSYLFLCEVITYGETVCPEGKYGFDCESTCKCGPTEACHPSTGTCAPPCKSDPASTDCSYQCHPNCNSKLCQEGDCATCVASECSSCKQGFSGPYCEDACPKGKYGEKCDKDCSMFCKGQTCNALNGHCDACVGSQEMPMCEDKGGGSGEEKKAEDGFEILYVLPLLALIPVAMCLLCCFMRKRRSQAPAAETKPADTAAVVPDPTATAETTGIVESGAGETAEGGVPGANETV